MITFAPELFRVSNSIKVNLLHKTQLKQLWQQIYKAPLLQHRGFFVYRSL
nr:MAG TPA: Respiratory burst NADPH oxidase [Caudoviricetes sp.]